MIHGNLGLALVAQGKLASAIIHYNESLRINPNTPLTYSNLGLDLAKKGDLDPAIR